VGTRKWTKYVNIGQSVNANTPDVGLVLMDAGQEFKLTTWPTIQRTQLPAGTQAFNIGRKNNGYLSSTDLYVGRLLTLNPARGYPTSYGSSEVIEPGDSGGPVLLPNGHTIVAVNSGAGGGTQVLARTDAVIADIDAQVKANGGWGTNGGPGDGGNPGGGTGGGTGTGGAGGGGGGECSDKNQYCAYWASIGECSKNPNYMLPNCCASCSKTGGGGSGGGGTQPALCSQCASDSDCGGARCLKFVKTGERFCSRDCSTTGCPSNYSCMSVPYKGKQCVPSSLTCGNPVGGTGGAGGTGGGSSGGTAGSGGSAGNPSSTAELCVSEINRYRSTVGAPALARWADAEACSNKEAAQDAASGRAHGSFTQCGEMAQNECPGWPGPESEMIKNCLRTMWNEGPGGGHYENMRSSRYTKVACGVAQTSAGKYWAVQNFR
jgi:hypothetical protein